MNIKNLRTVSLIIILLVVSILLSGCSGYVVVDDNEAPTAKIAPNKLGNYAPLKVTFDGSASSDADGNIISYDWEFGDGTTAQGVQTEHTFQDDGLYTVRLTVTDDEGATSSTTTSIKVLNPKPQVNFNFSPNVPLVGETVRFDAGETFDPASVQPQYVKSFRWSFGDGTQKNGSVVEKTYSQPGFYTVELSVMDDDNAMSTKTRQIEVEARPVARYSGKIIDTRNCNFSASSNSSTTNNITPQLEPAVCEVKVLFDGSESNDPQGNIVSYHWDFDDEGAMGSGPQTVHWFEWTDQDYYDVKLTVVDDHGLENSLTKRLSR